MRGYVANTDYDWYEFLRGRAPLDEVNFWRPSGKGSGLEPGTPFFFKLKAPYYAIAGFGFFARSSITPATLAWEAFGADNGAPTEAAMRTRIEKYRQAPPTQSGDYEIGCLMISQPVFFEPRDWIVQPDDWVGPIVTGKSYDLSVGEGRRIWDACRERVMRSQMAPPALIAASPEARYGAPMLVQPRLGQGTFRVAVTDAYGRACAVTSEHSLPVLEAAHIKPFSENGPHDVRNGLLLRSDVHRLFDRGYVTVTPEGHFEVSRRLREDFDNGKTYYALQGKIVQLPKRAADRPDPELLRWHNDTKFRAA